MTLPTLIEKTTNNTLSLSPLPSGRDANRVLIRNSAASLAIAGILFVFYPTLRPFSDEMSLAGAAAFASNGWIVSHTMAILAFVFMTGALLGLYVSFRDTPVERLAFRGLALTWFGSGLTLPFYGAEVFGLYAIGREVMTGQRLELMQLAGDIRFGPGFLMIVAGLLLVAAGSIFTAVAVWKSRMLPRWSGIPFAVGFLTYLPQFIGTQPIRIAHGLVVAIGCLWIAAGMWRQRQRRASH
ncbi:hypothetical protein MO973_31245 [Paenibacillus sp. TRM 82003]|nr:hypothetical protein [Paenibacillus sp. TRM 82003]